MGAEQDWKKTLATELYNEHFKLLKNRIKTLENGMAFYPIHMDWVEIMM